MHMTQKRAHILPNLRCTDLNTCVRGQDQRLTRSLQVSISDLHLVLQTQGLMRTEELD